MNRKAVFILGIYVTDLTFRAARMPLLGETIAGSAFKMGPGGKGSNQAVAAARAGAKVIFCTRIGNDAFGRIARATWESEGIDARATVLDDQSTGAAHIFVDEQNGRNAIIVAAGAAGTMVPVRHRGARSRDRGQRRLRDPARTARWLSRAAASNSRAGTA